MNKSAKNGTFEICVRSNDSTSKGQTEEFFHDLCRYHVRHLSPVFCKYGIGGMALSFNKLITYNRLTEAYINKNLSYPILDYIYRMLSKEFTYSHYLVLKRLFYTF